MTNHAEFKKKYGPWAVITGAAEGTGAAYARELASAGLNLVLLDWQQKPLDELAAALEAEHGIQTRTDLIDLFQFDAGRRVLEAAKGIEVGLFIANAGADTKNATFLEIPFESWRNLIVR